MTKRIENAINVFLDAINNGTLAKGTCKACAVGNLVAHHMDIIPVVDKTTEDYCNIRDLNEIWVRFIYPDSPLGINLLISIEEGEKIINSLDFTLEELKQIEDAFEYNAKINFNYYSKYTKEEIRQDQINGLKAVIEIMMTFDDVKENIDEVFTHKAELIPV